MLFVLFATLLDTSLPPQAPSGKWVVDFGEARCVATRQYGVETLALKASPMGDVVQVAIAEPGSYKSASQLDGELQPAGGVVTKLTSLRWGTGGKPGRQITLFNLPTAEFARIANASSLRLRAGGKERNFALTGMPALAKVMADCVSGLQAEWFFDASEGVGPKGNIAAFVKWSDFPTEGLDRDVSGTTSYALLINEQGRVADCTVTETSGQAVYDVQSCALLTRRARFIPAKGPDGKPRKGRVTGKIRWVVP